MSSSLNTHALISGPKYGVIYADPPWKYKDKASAGKRGAEYKYPVMTTEEIKELPVQALAAKDCVLFLWVTWPFLPVGLQVMEAWGFKYKTIGFVWKKTTKFGKTFWGMGNWTRANTEPCLLGVRGKPKRLSASIHQVVEAEIGPHSSKPLEVRSRITKLMGTGSRKLELFARGTHYGWDVWGNELED